MFRSRVALVLRPAAAAVPSLATATTHFASSQSPLIFSRRAESTYAPSANAQRTGRTGYSPTSPSSSSPSASSSMAQKIKMAAVPSSQSTGHAAATPVTPPVGDGKRMVKKKKIIKRIVKKSSSNAEDGIQTGEALRRELRGIGASAPAAAPYAEEEPQQQNKANNSYDDDEDDGYGYAEEETTSPAKARRASSASVAGEETEKSKSQKTTLIKGYRIDEITSLCTPSDAIFARRLPSGGCQFFAWPGTPIDVAASAIVSMPDTIRTVHAVFGRWQTPIDLVMDIDCAVPQEYWSMAKIGPFKKKLLDDTLSVVKDAIGKMGEKIATQVVLESPNLKKASFHIHTKLKDAAFADYNSLHGFLAPLHDQIPHVDLQIYRVNGMLRMFSCMKENHTSAIRVFEDAQWNIGFRNGVVPDEVAALHSVVVRPAGTYKRLLTFDTPRTVYTQPPLTFDGGNSHLHDGAAASTSANGAAVPRVPAVMLPRTEREAIENASRWLRNATEVEVGEWRPWIGLGICAFRIAHHFQHASSLQKNAMQEMLEAWVEASRHCPQKFRNGDCERRWASFDIDKLQGSTDWWRAYQRLGRLEKAIAENTAAEQKLWNTRGRNANPQKWN